MSTVAAVIAVVALALTARAVLRSAGPPTDSAFDRALRPSADAPPRLTALVRLERQVRGSRGGEIEPALAGDLDEIARTLAHDPEAGRRLRAITNALRER